MRGSAVARQAVSPAVLRLCYAVAALTKLRVGWWCNITTAFALLSDDDRAAEAILQAAVTAELVTINPAPTAHSITLATAGHRLCAEAAMRRNAPSPDFSNRQFEGADGLPASVV